MTTSCLACGAAVAPGSRFCPACGKAQPVPAAALLSPRFATPVSYTPRHLADRILNSRSALQGEHKRVTVVFCDIVDSSALAARLGGERMHGLLQRFFEIALGDTTNGAAHLQTAAERGGILMSDTTWERARDLVASQPVGPVVLKGKAEPVVAHAVTGIRAGKSGAVTRRLTEFVGRGRELA